MNRRRWILSALGAGGALLVGWSVMPARSRVGGRDALPADLPAQRHIGLYAYRVSFLRRFGQLAASPLERCESLEQLRALWHGHRIAVHVTDEAPGPGVDTPEDLARVQALLA